MMFFSVWVSEPVVGIDGPTVPETRSQRLEFVMLWLVLPVKGSRRLVPAQLLRLLLLRNADLLPIAYMDALLPVPIGQVAAAVPEWQLVHLNWMIPPYTVFCVLLSVPLFSEAKSLMMIVDSVDCWIPSLARTP